MTAIILRERIAEIIFESLCENGMVSECSDEHWMSWLWATDKIIDGLAANNIKLVHGSAA